MNQRETKKQEGSFRVLIATGGTGGHFYPALTVAYSVRKRGGEVVFAVGGQQATEHREQAEREGFRVFEVRAPRIPRGVIKKPMFIIQLAKGIFASLGVLRRIRPDCVMGMGSFASIPLCLAAGLVRYPLVLHEANALAGQANRFLSRFARLLMYSLPLRNEKSIHCSISDIGMPVRQELVKAACESDHAAVSESREAWGLRPDLPTVLVFGGSQGARFINETVPAAMDRLGDSCTQFQLIHLTGTENNEALREKYQALGLRARVVAKEQAMEKCYAIADIAVCRAGASTIAELALFGMPAVLIPLPCSKDAHQQANAQAMADHNAAVCRTQEDFNADTCAAYLHNWLEQPEGWKEMGRHLQAFGRPEAPDTIAEVLESYRSRTEDGDGE